MISSKCKVCDQKIKEPSNSVIELNTAEGIHKIKVCDDCARFFDMSAEVLSKSKRKPKDD